LEIYMAQLDYIEMNVQSVMVHEGEFVMDNLMMMVVVVTEVKMEGCHLFLLSLSLFLAVLDLNLTIEMDEYRLN
jgi:hypothetical protein